MNIDLTVNIYSSTIIETVQRKFGPHSTLAFAYFYFDFNDPEKQKYNNLLRSLITQLSWRFQSVPSALRELYSQKQNGTQNPTSGDLLTLFKKLCEPFMHTYIILDALDECTGTERSHVLGFVETLVGWGFDNLHLLVTSQKQPEIERRLESLNCNQLDLGTTLIHQDIQIYIQTMLAEDESFRHWRANEKKLIEDTLMNGANGM